MTTLRKRVDALERAFGPNSHTLSATMTDGEVIERILAKLTDDELEIVEQLWQRPTLDDWSEDTATDAELALVARWTELEKEILSSDDLRETSGGLGEKAHAP